MKCSHGVEENREQHCSLCGPITEEVRKLVEDDKSLPKLRSLKEATKAVLRRKGLAYIDPNCD